MVQVLPYVPGFGEKLAGVLGNAAGKIGEGYIQGKAEERLQSKLDKFRQKPNPYPETSALDEMGNIANESAQSKSLADISFDEMYDIVNDASKTAGGKEKADLIGKTLMQGKDLATKERIAATKEANKDKARIADRASRLTEGAIKENKTKRDALNKEDFDLKLGLQAVETGDVGGFDVNWFADSLGPIGQPLKNLAGIQLESAMKGVLIDTIQATAGRPNQWIEQQIKSATAGIGKSTEANKALIQAGLAKNQLQKALIDTEDELLASYEAKGLPPPANLSKIVHELVKPYAEQVQDKLAYDLRVQYEKSKGDAFLKDIHKVPQGTPLTREKRDALLKIYKNDVETTIVNAKKLGYVIPKSNG